MSPIPLHNLFSHCFLNYSLLSNFLLLLVDFICSFNLPHFPSSITTSPSPCSFSFSSTFSLVFFAAPLFPPFSLSTNPSPLPHLSAPLLLPLSLESELQTPVITDPMQLNSV